MPTYLLHGFRWPRPLIRIHIILQNLDDCAAEWLCSPTSTSSLLENFHDLFPASMPHLPRLRFIEQYDPSDTSAASLSQPFAYVADVVEEVKLGLDIDEVRGKGVGQEQWGALMEVRDRLAPDEKVGWWVVVCGDEERWAPREELARGGLGLSPTIGHVGGGSGGGGSNGIHDYSNGLGIANVGAVGPGGLGRREQEMQRLDRIRDKSRDVGDSRDEERRRDQGLRDLREQVGYRTESDTSDYSSGGVTRHTTGATAPVAAQRTPDTSLEAPNTPPGSAKKGSVRRWLSKRKSQRSMKELAKAQAKESPPPMPKSPAAQPPLPPQMRSPAAASHSARHHDMNGRLPIR